MATTQQQNGVAKRRKRSSNGAVIDLTDLGARLVELGKRLDSLEGKTPAPPAPPTSARRPMLDYIAGSVLFASSYLALGRRSRRGIAQVLPLVPAGIAALEWARRPNRDSGLATVASGAVGVGSLFLGPR